MPLLLTIFSIQQCSWVANKCLKLSKHLGWHDLETWARCDEKWEEVWWEFKMQTLSFCFDGCRPLYDQPISCKACFLCASQNCLCPLHCTTAVYSIWSRNRCRIDNLVMKIYENIYHRSLGARSGLLDFVWACDPCSKSTSESHPKIWRRKYPKIK